MDKQPMTDEEFYRKYETFEKQGSGYFRSRKPQAKEEPSETLEEIVEGKVQ